MIQKLRLHGHNAVRGQYAAVGRGHNVVRSKRGARSKRGTTGGPWSPQLLTVSISCIVWELSVDTVDLFDSLWRRVAIV